MMQTMPATEARTADEADQSGELDIDVDALPLTTRFTLGKSITNVQRRFLEKHGYLVFANVAKRDEIAMIASELEHIEKDWVAQKRKTVYGIPLFWGKNKNRPFLQRFPFTSVFSEKIHAFVRDDRFAPIRDLVGNGARIGDREKDGVVVNRYINMPGSAYPKLGWHTDGVRDLFYLRVPKPMLNIGLHLDECPKENGGLRLIPGSHKQGFFSMAFGKIYYSDRPDRKEIAVETHPGDLTVHDGNLWHRVALSTRKGPTSLRRSMYVPYLTDEFQPKDSKSKTPLYHHLGAAIRKVRSWFS
jgi:phytanoyl-CoA hydroxylase